MTDHDHVAAIRAAEQRLLEAERTACEVDAELNAAIESARADGLTVQKFSAPSRGRCVRLTISRDLELYQTPEQSAA